MRVPDEALAARLYAQVLDAMGFDVGSEGLAGTPGRVVRALAEMTGGYDLDAGKILSTTFDADGYDELVLLKGIEFTSLCEHHVLPFQGRAHVAYIPGARVVGLSKLARLVDAHARRLQIQERMTRGIANDLQRHLAPLGVGVIVEARHECMACRGVRKAGATMVTSAMLGAFREDAGARAELLALVRAATP